MCTESDKCTLNKQISFIGHPAVHSTQQTRPHHQLYCCIAQKLAPTAPDISNGIAKLKGNGATRTACILPQSKLVACPSAQLQHQPVQHLLRRLLPLARRHQPAGKSIQQAAAYTARPVVFITMLLRVCKGTPHRVPGIQCCTLKQCSLARHHQPAG
jgi:hypothetical protein